MSANVRRLLLDLQPLWIVFAVIMVTEVLVTNVAWLMRPRIMMLFASMFISFGPVMMVQMKGPTWRLLPVSRLEIARARWWAGLGIPIAVLTLLLAVPYAVIQRIGGGGATPLQALALLGGQIAVCLPVGVSVLLARTTVARLGAIPAAVIILLSVLLPLSSLLIKGAPSPPVQALLIGLGALALILAALTYGFSGALSRAAQSADRLAQVADRDIRRHEAKGRRGWPAIAVPVARVALMWGAFMAGADLFFSHVLHRGQSVFVLILSLTTGYILGAFIPFSIRVLRGLPVGPARLTLILQGTLAVSAGIGILLLAVVFRLTDQDTTDLPPFLMIVLALTAWRLPMDLRLGQQVALFASMIPLIGAPFLLFLDTSRIMDGALAVMALSWVWTWWELAHGRGAYKPRPFPAQRRRLST